VELCETAHAVPRRGGGACSVVVGCCEPRRFERAVCQRYLHASDVNHTSDVRNKSDVNHTSGVRSNSDVNHTSGVRSKGGVQ
jgi:hypothetical protein